MPVSCLSKKLGTGGAEVTPKKVRQCLSEEGASMLVGIICAFLWPLVLIAYFFDKKNGKL